MQNQRLLQLESSYKITSTADKKLRRDVANWQKLDADTRWSVCQKLWENIHRTQGLRDLRNCLRRYVQEQKWPAPVTGEKPPVSAANRMQLLTRLPVVKENLEASQGVKDLEHALTKTQDHSYDHIDGIMKKISAKLGITPHELHQEFKKQHSMTPDDWVRIANVRAIRETSSSGGTSAGAIASVANPVGKVNRRPSLFGYVPEDSRPPKRKNIFQVGDQVKSRWGDRKDEKPHTITKIDGDFIHTDEQSFFNPENSLFHHENFVLYKRRQDM
jgi:AraC-like DNA-binding protein